MIQSQLHMTRLNILVFMVVVVTGCNIMSVNPNDTENVRVTMQKIASAVVTQTLKDGLANVADRSYVPIDLNNVTSFAVEITSVEFLPVTANEENDIAWIRLSLDPAVTLDLLALPTSEDSPIVLTVGLVDEGAYRMVRLLVSGGTIMFDADVSVGQFTFAGAPESHLVTIPSGAQTGLKTNLVFTIGEGGSTEVNLLFDESATFQNVIATGSGTVIIRPMLQ